MTPRKHTYAVDAVHLRKEFPKRRKGLGLLRRLHRPDGRDVRHDEREFGNDSGGRETRQAGSGSTREETTVAVSDVSFAVQPGEVFGLLGPNGAGKTTTIRMLCTLLEPTSGSATVNGYDTVREAPMVRRSLGTVLTGERSTYWKLTGRENLEYFAALYGLSRKEQRARATAILERLGLADKADQLVETYSSGMKQRLALGRALLAGQPILLLDEPTIGLDPAAALWDSWLSRSRWGSGPSASWNVVAAAWGLSACTERSGQGRGASLEKACGDAPRCAFRGQDGNQLTGGWRTLLRGSRSRTWVSGTPPPRVRHAPALCRGSLVARLGSSSGSRRRFRGSSLPCL